MRKLVMFDMDGVLFDSMPGHAKAWKQTFLEAGYEFDERPFYMNEGRTGAGTISLLLGPQVDYEAMYRHKCEIFDAMPPAKVMEGALETVGKVCAAGLKAIVVTGSAQGILLKRIPTDFNDLFCDTVTALDVSHGKPDPEPYLMGLRKAGVRADEAIVVENAPLGIQAGHAAGCYVIAVNTGPLEDEVLLEAGADIVLSSMTELSEKIEDIIKG